MGLYDRDYVRDEPRGFFLGGNRTMVINLVLVNAAVYLADLLFTKHLPNGVIHPIGDALKLPADFFQHPWRIWQIVTYGFVHDPNNFFHIVFNMFGLWMFGREVEDLYGRAEFLRIYLSLIALCGIVWAATQSLLGLPGGALVRASGAVTGVIVLFVLQNPKRTLLLWGVVPVPAWAMGIAMIVINLWGLAAPEAGDHVAYEVHLTGALLAAIYRQSGLNLGRLVPARLRNVRLGRPSLRVHDPERGEADLGTQVDRILEKISREGEASLTRDERRTLEAASRRYQQRRR